MSKILLSSNVAVGGGIPRTCGAAVAIPLICGRVWGRVEGWVGGCHNEKSIFEVCKLLLR